MDGACQHEARSTAARSFHPSVDAISGVRRCDVATGLTHDTIKMMNDVHQQDREGAAPRADEGSVQWRSRYDGLVTIAELGGKAVAGISGPWSGQYALTWWDRPLPTRSLDLFGSLDEAKREVEGWARRMSTGNYSLSAAGVAHSAKPALRPLPVIASPIAIGDYRRVAAPPSTLLGWVRAFLPDLRSQKTAAATNDVERLRLRQARADIELGDDLHFSADE